MITENHPQFLDPQDTHTTSKQKSQNQLTPPTHKCKKRNEKVYLGKRGTFRLRSCEGKEVWVEREIIFEMGKNVEGCCWKLRLVVNQLGEC